MGADTARGMCAMGAAVRRCLHLLSLLCSVLRHPLELSARAVDVMATAQRPRREIVHLGMP